MKLLMYIYEIDKTEWFPHERGNGGRKSCFAYVFLKQIFEGLLDCHYFRFRIKEG